MTQDQATTLLAAVADLQQQTQALGQLLARVTVWCEVLCLLALCLLFFAAIRRR